MSSKIATLISSLPAVEPQLLVLLFLQYVLTFLLPPVYAFLPILALLLGIRLTTHFSRGSASPVLKPEDYTKDVKMGRWTAQPGGRGDNGTGKLAQEEVVCFIIAASSNQCVLIRFLFLSEYCVGVGGL